MFNEKEYQKQYRATHREKLRQLNHEWKIKRYDRNNELNQQERDRLKIKVLTYYSNNDIPKCVLCGYTQIEALCLDHIMDNGAEERKKFLGNRLRAGTDFYRWIKRNNFPTGYQTLCYNCNMVKEVKRRRYGNSTAVQV